METIVLRARELEQHWNSADRWKGIKRSYSAEDVIKLQGSVKIRHSLAEQGAFAFKKVCQGTWRSHW